MSIILDALKKAQSSKKKKDVKDKEVSGNAAGDFRPKVTAKASSPGRKSRVPSALLAIAAIIGLGGMIYYQFGGAIKTMLTKAPLPNSVLTKTIVKTPQTTKPTNETADQKEQKENEEKITKLKEDAARRFQKGKFDESASIYKKLTYLAADDAEVYNNYGVALKKANKIRDAKQAYGTALALNPDYPEALNNLAVLLMSERQYVDAKSKLEKAIEVNPDYLDAYLHLALCLEKIGDLQSSINYYQSFLKLSEGKVSRNIRLQIENRIVRLNEDI